MTGLWYHKDGHAFRVASTNLTKSAGREAGGLVSQVSHVKSVQLAVDNETCDTYAREIVENPPFSEGNSSYCDGTSGYKWKFNGRK